MSTFLNFFVKISGTDQLIDVLKKFSDFDLSHESQFPQGYYHNYLSEDADPEYLIIERGNDGWLIVYHNSFKKLYDWGREISNSLDTSFIQIIGQTTSDVYYFSLFEKGVLRREIEVLASEGEILIDKGSKFPFEKSTLLSDDADDSNGFFDMDTLEVYCMNFGLDINGIFESSKNGYTVLKQSKQKKVWWKIWQ